MKANSRPLLFRCALILSVGLLFSATGAHANSVFAFHFNNGTGTFGDRNAFQVNWAAAVGPLGYIDSTSGTNDGAEVGVSQGTTSGAAVPTLNEQSTIAGFLFAVPTNLYAPGVILLYTTNLNSTTNFQGYATNLSPFQSDWFRLGTNNLSSVVVSNVAEISVYTRAGTATPVMRFALRVDGNWYASTNSYTQTDLNNYLKRTLTPGSVSWYSGIGAPGVSLDNDLSDNPIVSLNPAGVISGYGLYADTEAAAGANARVRIDSYSVRLVGNIPPSIAITNLTITVPSTIKEGSVLTLKAEATDPDGTIVSVQFFWGTNLLGTVASAPWEFAFTDTVGGVTNIFSARATDNNGAQTTSQPKTVIVTPTSDLAVFTASYVTSGAGYDAGEAVEIAPDGNVVYAGTLDSTATPAALLSPSVITNNLLGGGKGIVLRLQPNGTKVLSIARLGLGIDDMDVNRSNGVIAVVGNFGLAVLNSNATAVLWTSALSTTTFPSAANDLDGRRVAVASDGTIATLDNKNVKVFNAAGAVLGSWTESRSHANDITVDAVSQRVFVTGYDDKTLPSALPVKVTYLAAYSYEGSQQWLNWGWDGGQLGTLTAADTIGMRLAMGRDGYLYYAAEVAGGNSIFNYWATDLGTANANNVSFDTYTSPANTASEHKTYFCRLDPASGYLWKGQYLVARLPGTNTANTIIPRAVTSDENGYVYIGGLAYSSIEDRSLSTVGGFSPASYNGGDPFLVVVKPDFTKRVSWNVLSGPAGGSNVPANGSQIRSVAVSGGIAALASTATGEIITTPNALQPAGNTPTNGTPDGYFATFVPPAYTNAVGLTFADWRRTYFNRAQTTDFNIGSAAADSDGDGWSNFVEFEQGSDPLVNTNASLITPAISSIKNSGGQVVITFNAESNQGYTLQSRTNVASGTWSNAFGIEPAPGLRVISVTNAPTAPANFFRLVSPKQ
jgi:hypothetical protein